MRLPTSTTSNVLGHPLLVPVLQRFARSAAGFWSFPQAVGWIPSTTPLQCVAFWDSSIISHGCVPGSSLKCNWPAPSDLHILDTRGPFWRKGPFLYLFWASLSWLGKVLNLRCLLQRQLARSSKKTAYLHAYLHKPVWTSWPVAFPSSSKGIKEKFHILNLRINHKVQISFFFLSQIHLCVFLCMYGGVFLMCFPWALLDVFFSSFCCCSAFPPPPHVSWSCFCKWI